MMGFDASSSQICCSRLLFGIDPFTVRKIPCNFYELYGVRAPRKFYKRKVHVMLGICTNILEYKHIITYYYNVHNILLVQTGGRGGGEWRASWFRLRGVSPRGSPLAARDSRLASPRLSCLASPRLDGCGCRCGYGCGSGSGNMCYDAFPGNIYWYISPFPPPGRPAGS